MYNKARVLRIPDIDSILTIPQAQQTLRGLTQHTEAMDFAFTITMFGFFTTIISVVTVVVTDIIITSISTTVKPTVPVLKFCCSGYGLGVFAINVILCLPRVWSLKSSA